MYLWQFSVSEWLHFASSGGGGGIRLNNQREERLVVARGRAEGGDHDIGRDGNGVAQEGSREIFICQVDFSLSRVFQAEGVGYVEAA